jgi:hypothetical protein
MTSKPGRKLGCLLLILFLLLKNMDSRIIILMAIVIY